MDNITYLDLYSEGVPLQGKRTVDYLVEDQVKCFRAEDNRQVLNRGYLYKEYFISPREMGVLVANYAIGQLIRGEKGKCDDGWCLFTIDPEVLVQPFSKEKKNSYIGLKQWPEILTMLLPNPISEKRVEYIHKTKKNGLIEYPCMPVIVRIGEQWYYFDEIFESGLFDMDNKIINEFALFLCNKFYLEQWYRAIKQYNDKYGWGHNGYGDQQESVISKQNLILHYGTSKKELTQVMDRIQFVNNIKGRN